MGNGTKHAWGKWEGGSGHLDTVAIWIHQHPDLDTTSHLKLANQHEAASSVMQTQHTVTEQIQHTVTAQTQIQRSHSHSHHQSARSSEQRDESCM